MQKLLPYLVALSAFVVMPAIAADDSISDQMKIQMAEQQHVWVRPAEVNARIDQFLTEQHLTAAQVQTVLVAAGQSPDAMRHHIIMQIMWEKTAH